MSSTRFPAGNYQYGPGPRSNQQSMNYGDTPNTQNFSIPPSLYVERRSVNPVPINQPNQAQYIESDRSKIGYENARALQAQSSSMYNQPSSGKPMKTVNPVLKNNSMPSSSPYATYGKESVLIRKDLRPEIDDSPIIDPRAFHYLSLEDKNAAKGTSRPRPNDGGIDTRPIVNIDAVTQLERRRQQQLEKNNRVRGDDGSGPGIDERSIVDLNAFRHIESKGQRNRAADQQDPALASGIDERPITNPNAFKYLENRREAKTKNSSDEPAIDTRPIINPEAFKYLEQRSGPITKTVEDSGIDSKPIVNPEAFRYLEQRNLPVRQQVESGIDTTSRINPKAFEYIEQKTVPKQLLDKSTIDTRPIVNPQAFKWIEHKDATKRVDDGPDVDERSYVNPKAFLRIDQRPKHQIQEIHSEIDTRSFILDRNPNALAHLEREVKHRNNENEQSGVDQRSYMNPAAFRYLEGRTVEPRRNENQTSTIETKSYVNPNAFRHLEMREQIPGNLKVNENEKGIDERSFVSPHAFRHLEPSTNRTTTETNDHLTYGQTDF